MNSHHVNPLLNFPPFSLIEFERIFNKSSEAKKEKRVHFFVSVCLFGDSLQHILIACGANPMWAFRLGHLSTGNIAKGKAAVFTRVKAGVLMCIWPRSEHIAFGLFLMEQDQNINIILK